ncbi:MAG: aspartate aminotransferase family protein [Desulfovibrionaceae bacterium]|nr:aspartate aminotransferase family protein [Desulfovibrionaceae bacterium]
MSEKFDQIKAREEQLLCRSYSRYPIAIHSGNMSHLTDVDGKEYVDLLAGIAVAAVGHCNPEICAVLAEQSHKLWHVSNLFYQEEQLELASLLLQTTHHDKVFFCNSGAEANEACIKLARRYMQEVRHADRYEIITLSNCFHGRTLATLAATGRENLSRGFGPLPAGFKQVPCQDLAALKASITEHTAAVMLEVVQGEAGVIPLDHAYLKGVEALCREQGILLICDEVQAGFCRTGTFWAFQQHDLKPDIMSTAKALANGLAMGCMLATNEVAKGFEPGSHATTFGGGALVSKVASKTIEIMLRDNLAARAAEVGTRLKARLDTIQKAYPKLIKEVRGQGLMLGIEFYKDGPKVWEELLQRGFICSLSHNANLRLLPALNIPESDLEAFCTTLEAICAQHN